MSGTEKLNGKTMSLVSLQEFAQTRKASTFSSFCTPDIIQPCFEGGWISFLSVGFLALVFLHGMIRHHEKQTNRKKILQKNRLVVFLSDPALCLREAHPMKKEHSVHSAASHTHLSTSFTHLLSVIAFTLLILLIMSFMGNRCNFMQQSSVCVDLSRS